MKDNKKKILIINQHFSTGGIKKSLENLLPILMSKYDVKVVFISGRTQEFDEKFPNVSIDSPFILSSCLSSAKEIKHMNYSGLRVMIKILFFILSKFVPAEKLVKFSVDLARFLGDYDCVISYAHDNWFGNGDFFGGGNYLAIKKTKSNNKISWVHGEPKTIGLNKRRLIYTYSNFDHVVAVSDAVKEQFENMSEGKIRCEKIYNILDVDSIRAKSASTEYIKELDKFKIVTVGRLSKVAKRIDKVNEIAKRLRDAGYTFHWIVVGGGSEYEACVNKCKEYKLDEIVEYTGNKDNPYPYMKNSDILVLVSDTEAMSLVINEALVVGTPVVTTDFPAAYESVIDGVTGFITKKDVESLYTKIAYCIEHRELLDEMRNNIMEHPYSNEMTISAIENMVG